MDCFVLGTYCEVQTCGEGWVYVRLCSWEFIILHAHLFAPLHNSLISSHTICPPRLVLSTLIGSSSPQFQTGIIPGPTWKWWGLNLWPSACKEDALPLSYRDPSPDCLPDWIQYSFVLWLVLWCTSCPALHWLTFCLQYLYVIRNF